jgi:aminoglycoside phosphotransferase (APT) family kinase protein
MPSARMHDREVHTDADLVRRLLREQFPGWSELPIERVASSGTDHALYRLGRELVARLPRIDWAVGQAELEHRWLPILAPHLPLEVPVPLAVGMPGLGYPWPWSVVPWIEGRDLTVVRDPDRSAYVDDLAGFVRALRSIDPDGAPAPQDDLDRGVPLANRDAATREAIARLRGDLDTGAVAAAWDAAVAAPPWDRRPTWIHGDLQGGNLIEHGGRLRAVIDFGCLGAGDPACDLLGAWSLFGAADRARFRAAVDVDDASWSRGRGWALSVALIYLPYYRDTNPSGVAIARRVVREVLADLVIGT